LKTISSYYNPAAEQDGAHAAVRLARDTLDELGLFSEKGASGLDDPGAPNA
jgi:hypothetical protein